MHRKTSSHACRTHYDDEKTATFVSFSIPAGDNGCHLFHYSGGANESASYCNPSYFDRADLDTCQSHVYDTAEYGWSFAMQEDLADCQDMEDWPLYVSLQYLVIC